MMTLVIRRYTGDAVVDSPPLVIESGERNTLVRIEIPPFAGQFGNNKRPHATDEKILPKKELRVKLEEDRDRYQRIESTS
jgi:hypothetical protein